MTRTRKSLLQARIKGLVTGGVLATLVLVVPASTLDAQQPPGPRDNRVPLQNDQIIELNRGPVHEAFAQPYEMKSGGDFVVNQEPPRPIDEVPPRQVPQSSEFEWIPGYWGWEPGDERFIWISGIFRKAPEEMTWNPGYWTRVDNGYAWVSGCWVRDGELYLVSATPPDPKPENPGQQPSPQHFWVPGHWDYSQRDYQWNPGFWARGIEDRVWVPARYLWTPRGYLAVDGYWDFPLEERGILYSPVAFREIPDPGFRYSPTLIVRTSYLPTHLFVYGHYGHYCYGDYYGFNPSRGRFYPWAMANARYYDPLRIFFTTFRRDRFDYYRNRHDYYHDHADYRPRHNWRDQRRFTARGNVNVADALLAVGINELIDGDDGFRTRVRFDEDQERWNREVERNKQFREFRQRRESAFRPQRDGDRNRADDIDLGPIRVRVNPDDVPNSINRGRGRGDANERDRGPRGENRERPNIDPRENRNPEDRDQPIKRDERRLPDPRDRNRDNPLQKPDRPEIPNRPDVPNRPKTPRRPDLPDKPEKPDKPKVPDVKPGQSPKPKELPEIPSRNIEKPERPQKDRGKPENQLEKLKKKINN